MRTIKFRGYSTRDKKWYFGEYHYHEVLDKHFINHWWKPSTNKESWSLFKDEVDPETIGQFTESTDMLGKDMYEGDICEVRYTNDTPTKTGVVIWNPHHSHFTVQTGDLNYSLNAGGSIVKGICVIGKIV